MSASKPKILIVDDDLDLLFAMKKMFRKQNYDILLASNGEEALKIVEENDLTLVISDVRMPKMNGIQLLDAMNVKGLEIPVIVISGYTDYSPEEVDQRDGVVLLDKATNVSQLRSIVEEYISLLPERGAKKAS